MTVVNTGAGEPSLEGPSRRYGSVVQNLHQRGFSRGHRCVQLPLLEEHAERLQEGSQSRLLQLEGVCGGVQRAA